MKAVTYDLICVRAYQIWEEEGRPDGRADAHWFQAERELLDAAPQIPDHPEVSAEVRDDLSETAPAATRQPKGGVQARVSL